MVDGVEVSLACPGYPFPLPATLLYNHGPHPFPVASASYYNPPQLLTFFFFIEFKEIRKEWKARKKEEETQRKAAEERERAAAQAAQASQVEGPPSDPQAGQPSAYGGRPQLPPIGYQPADSQVPSQYGGPGGGMVYQSNGQMGYPPNYPHSPYQSGPVYQQRE